MDNNRKQGLDALVECVKDEQNIRKRKKKNTCWNSIRIYNCICCAF